MDFTSSTARLTADGASNDAVAAHPSVRTLLQMCEAPDDAPDIVAVHLALVHCLTAVASRQPAVWPFVTQMRDISRFDLLSAQAPSTSVVALLARRGRVATWAWLREIGRTDLSRLPAQVATTALAILGAALLRGLLDGSRVDGKLVARTRDALARPNSHAAQSWSSRARERSLLSQLRSLEQTLVVQAAAARRLGLTPPATVQLEAQPSSAAALILALLLTLAVPRYFGGVDAAREAVLRQNLKEARSVIDQFKADTGRYPESLQELVDRAYLRAVPADPITESFGTWEIVAPPPGTKGHVYDLRSGAQGQGSDGRAYRDW